MKGTIKLKKEAYRTWLACRSPEATDWYRQAKQNATLEVSKVKILVWEEFGEAMERKVSLENVLAKQQAYQKG